MCTYKHTRMYHYVHARVTLVLRKVKVHHLCMGTSRRSILPGWKSLNFASFHWVHYPARNLTRLNPVVGLQGISARLVFWIVFTVNYQCQPWIRRCISLGAQFCSNHACFGTPNWSDVTKWSTSRDLWTTASKLQASSVLAALGLWQRWWVDSSRAHGAYCSVFRDHDHSVKWKSSLEWTRRWSALTCAFPSSSCHSLHEHTWALCCRSHDLDAQGLVVCNKQHWTVAFGSRANLGC